ncbi:hypothetical protein Ae201684_010474 [Aphanomyces euteiches]|uniref:Multidrug resistance-associated protein 1 n=1 Tax=Aphanomyces euteiches TaxID=100861 RepID=A0A6G0WY64_9STRA|nr:hypothetical protein Ae201684_010474 [Aphanomyces euteiches]
MRDKLYNTFGPVGGGAHPLDTASIWSKIGFSWAEPLIALGNQRQLSPDDLWSLQSTNNVAKLTSTFSGAFKSHSQGVIRAFFAVYLWKYLWLGLLQLFTAVCDLYGPGFVLGQIIATLEAPTFDTEYVLKLVGSLFVVMTASALVKAHVAFLNDILGIQFTASLRSMVFTKALKLSAKSRKEKSAGDIANLFGTDVLNMMEFANYSHQLWIVPVQILIVLGLLYRLVGWASLVGLAIVGLVLWINSRSAIALGKAEMQLLKRKDDRTKLLTELFGAIQIVKFNAWEEKFGERAQGLRDLEVGALRVFYKYLILIQSLLGCTPVLVALSVFATFTLGMKQVLTVTVVFSTVALFKSLQEAIESLPVSITTFMQSLVSAKRLNAMLVMEVVDQTKVQTPANIDKSHEYAEEHVVVAIEDGSFGWDADNLLFRNINLKVHQGELVVIHGAVGQGKSSLCSILLGEMVKTNGSVFVGGQVAYFSQQPWIQNTTIRENILFGKPYDRTKYDKVIDACALAKDMASFPAGDRTEIGAKGLNLSGGQKARVSLARACYSDADVFILDSPLSAVDAIVSSEIFRKCFQGLLHHKTVLLVTHNPEIIASPEVAKAYLIQDGQITESTRSPTTLSPVAEEKSPLVSPLRQRRPYWEASYTEAPVVVRKHDSLLTPTASTPYNFKPVEMLFTPRGKDVNESHGRLVKEEVRAVGRVSKAVVFKYLECIGGWPAITVLLLVTVGMQAFKITSDLWLTKWSNDTNHMDPAVFVASVNYNMSVYGSLALGCCVFTAIGCACVFIFSVRGANKLFSAMLASLLEAPMRFFDTNPIGRLLNRFGDDVTSCDLNIPFGVMNMLFEASSALLTIGTTLVLTQWLGIFILPLMYIYIRIGAYFLEPLREVNRIQKTTRSPLISLVSEGIDGSTTIRAFGDKQRRRFQRFHDQELEVFCATRFANSSINQWFSLRIELLSDSIVAVLLLAVVVLHDTLSPGLVGLLITYGLTIPSNLAFLVNIWSRLETSMISPERILEYINVEHEGHRDGSPQQQWPTVGRVVFDNVSFRYKPNDPLVLKNVSFDVQGGEKIGIVGRTGAGKSSLMMALFRINEVASGRIQIDGMDTATIGLKTLRNSLAIIPQNPVLFKGTLRNYLDPFDEYSDEQLWSALRKVKLMDRLSTVEEKLLGPVEENGDNFSVGERQMLCMARALLRQAKIVVLDEATAAIDHATDQLLQAVIRDEFASSTVLTIAHRLDTVLDNDRVMVFDHGELVQCDKPSILVAQGSGIFFELVSEGGYMDKMTRTDE